MRLFLTGATGLVGRHTLSRAIDRGHQVTVLARDPSRIAREDRVTVLAGDLSLAASRPETLRGHDAVINCAGVLSSPDSAAFEAGNAEGPARLYRAAREASVPSFVHVGSMGVYGASGTTVTESTPLEPRPEIRGLYTASKMEGDRRLLEQAGSGPPALAILRPATVFGHGSALPLGRISKQVPGGFVLVGGSFATPFPIIYAGNLADAILAAAERAATGIYNLADQADLTQGAFHSILRAVRPSSPRPLYVPAALLLAVGIGADFLRRAVGGNSSIAYRMRRTLAPGNVSSARAAADLGHAPRVDLAEALRLTIAGRAG